MTHLYPYAMALTDFGESTVLISTTLAVAGCFWLVHQRQLAMLWLLAVGGCAATMVVLKLAFLTCGDLVLQGSVHTPSGHSSLSAVFYGAAALTVGRIAPPMARHRALMVLGTFLFAVLIGLSRIVVHAHSPQEVVIGLAVGFSWLIGFAILLRRVTPSREMPTATQMILLAALYGGLLIVTMAGEHMTVEGVLAHVAHLIHVHWDVCVG